MVVESVEPNCLFTISFNVIRARKDDKKNKTRFFSPEKKIGTQQTIII